eukprot:snap_masked-scaffold_35-processed-gene-2.52-mRNA-1 protein AED:1.00 eAED:1.00 QI:0/0/0/0/1/1/3/0/91
MKIKIIPLHGLLNYNLRTFLAPILLEPLRVCYTPNEFLYFGFDFMLIPFQGLMMISEKFIQLFSSAFSLISLSLSTLKETNQLLHLIYEKA